MSESGGMIMVAFKTNESFVGEKKWVYYLLDLFNYSAILTSVDTR